MFRSPASWFSHSSKPTRTNFAKGLIIGRWTQPLWFYVSVTGVIVCFMLYQIYAAH